MIKNKILFALLLVLGVVSSCARTEYKPEEVDVQIEELEEQPVETEYQYEETTQRVISERPVIGE